MEYGFAFFPGQGAQAPGMGKDLYDNSQAARLVFEEASEGAGLDVAKLCFDSDKETLSRTENSQIAIFTHSMAALAALTEAGVTFKAAAGFSLGEYTALAAAGVVSLADGVKIVSMRGKLMQQAADAIDGGMAAILGLDDAKIEQACAAVKSGLVRPVNYNCPGQLVCAGEKSQIEAFCQKVEEAGGRAKMLAVSGGFHSPFMESASDALREVLAGEELREPKVPVYANFHAKPYTLGSAKELLVQQVKNPVRWQETVEALSALGVDTFIECGPGKTLSGLIRKTVKDATVLNVQDGESLSAALEALGR